MKFTPKTFKDVLEHSEQSTDHIPEQTPLTALKKYKPSEIIYLTADSPNTLTALDPSHAYVIGGIVDRNRYLNLTFNKAIELGIGHAKLPIKEHMKLNTSAVLTVNHVYDILATQFNLKDWKKTLG